MQPNPRISYTLVALQFMALVLNEPSTLRRAVVALLVAVLVVKLRYEERLLTAHFPDYPAYQQTTRRLIPFLF